MGVLGLRHFSVVSVGIEAPVSVTNSQRRKTFMGRNIKQDGFSFPRWCKLNPFFDSCSLWVWSVRVRECGAWWLRRARVAAVGVPGEAEALVTLRAGKARQAEAS